MTSHDQQVPQNQHLTIDNPGRRCYCDDRGDVDQTRNGVHHTPIWAIHRASDSHGVWSTKMSTRKRILNWDLSAGKPEPLIEAEAVITLFYHMQRVAPQVWSDLITRTSSATTREDLMKTVAEWATEWRFCGPTGLTEWAFLVGIASAESIPIPFRPLRDLPNGHYLALPPVVDQATARRLMSAAARVLVDIETAKAVFSATVTPVPYGPYHLLGD